MPSSVIQAGLGKGVFRYPLPHGYYIFDKFTTARAAGSVNGTPAEPIGPTRTVVGDAHNSLSIANGVLTLANDPVGSSPRILYDVLPIPRAFGRVLKCKVLTLDDFMVIGWSDNIGNSQHSFLLQTGGGSNLSFVGPYMTTSPGYTTVSDGNYTLPAEIAVVLRTAGAYWFIKDAVSNWKLVWHESLNNASVYGVLGSASGDSSVATLDDFRITTLLYTVPCLAFDIFTRADGPLGSSPTSGPDSQTVVSRTWTTQLGTWGISANAAVASALSSGVAIATIDCGDGNVLIRAGVNWSAGVAGLVLRYQDSSNYLIAYHDGTNAKLDKVVAGVTTNLISGVATYSSLAPLQVSLDGGNAFLAYNWVIVGSASSVPTFSGATKMGLYTTNIANALDNFIQYARGSSNEYSGLDADDFTLT